MKKLFILSSLVIMVACAPFKEPEFKSYDGVEMGKMDGDKINFTLKSTVENPNFYALKVKPSKLEVYIDGKKMGDLYLDQKLKLKAKKETTIAAPMHIELESGTMMKLMGLALKDTIHLQLKGDVKGGVLFIYKNVPVNYMKNIPTKGINPLGGMNPFNRKN